MPDVITYSAVISAHEKAGDARGASYWFKHLLANGPLFITSNQPDGVVPDVITYNAVISAHEKAGDGQASALLDSAIERGVLWFSLGFDPEHNLLDLHEPAVVIHPPTADRPRGISSDLAKVIFRRLADLGTINRQTTFVVGRHGTDRLKEAIAQCMRVRGWTPVHPRDADGTENEGCWVAKPDAPDRSS